jgi:metal-responsive CopG/Arc/MetJ family transcriptional regulator
MSMKTAVSIPDDLFAEADALAKKQRRSRSGLYARALREYVDRHSPDSITAALNAYCAEESTELDPLVEAATRDVWKNNPW